MTREELNAKILEATNGGTKKMDGTAIAPLYIVDGVKAASIAAIDPARIASVKVLKDAEAAAVYGAKGGVIIVTTEGN